MCIRILFKQGNGCLVMANVFLPQFFFLFCSDALCLCVCLCMWAFSFMYVCVARSLVGLSLLRRSGSIHTSNTWQE